MAEPKDHDMILVMGVTGAGKSYFINKLTEESVVEGNTLHSCQLASQVVAGSFC